MLTYGYSVLYAMLSLCPKFPDEPVIGVLSFLCIIQEIIPQELLYIPTLLNETTSYSPGRIDSELFVFVANIKIN